MAMKYLLIISIFSLMSVNSKGQVYSFQNIPNDVLKHLNEMGVDNSSFLNSYESDYLNVIFQNSREAFDFSRKKIGFITGSNGGTQSNKNAYFEKEKERYAHGQSPNKGFLYVFNETQKKESGGYDAVIVYWCKILLRVEDLPQKLK